MPPDGSIIVGVDDLPDWETRVTASDQTGALLGSWLVSGRLVTASIPYILCVVDDWETWPSPPARVRLYKLPLGSGGQSGGGPE